MKRATRFVGVLLLGLVALPWPMWAMCNSIPVVETWFPSTIGSVDQPIAAPLEKIRLRLNPACGENQSFNDTQKVEFTFAGGAKKDAPDFHADSPQLLTVTVPDTGDLAPNGLAGPVDIKVISATNATLAEISTLNEPTSACDHQPETAFQQFTVLPKPNDLSVSSDLVATLDGGGNLLIPLDHSKILPVSANEALAAFETGKGFFKLFKNQSQKAWEGVIEAVKHGASRWDLLEVYSIQGRRLPALALFDSEGGLFGTADGAFTGNTSSRVSVLRFPRYYNTTELYDLSYLSSGANPIVFGNGAAKDVTIAVCHDPSTKAVQAIRLTGLRVSPEIIGYTRADAGNEGILQIHDADTGGKDCGKETKLAPLTATSAGLARPYVEVGERLVAAVGPGSGGAASALHVYRANGSEFPTATSASPLTSPLLNDRNMVSSNSFVFFVQSVGKVDTLRVFSGGLAPDFLNAQIPVVKGAVSNARGAIIGPIGQLTVYDAPNDATTPVVGATTVGDAALSPAILAFTSATGAVASTKPGWLTVQSVGIPAPLPTPFLVKADETAAVDQDVVFISPESAAAATDPGCTATSPPGSCDLNNDNDANDRVLRVLLGGQSLSETRFPAVDFVVGQVPGDRYVAFRSPEAQQDVLDALCGKTADNPPRCDRNGDHKADDNVMLVYQMSTGTTFNTGRAASRCEDLCRKFGLEWMIPYAIRGHHLFFITNEGEQEQDLNGDGDMLDDVLEIFDLDSKKIWSVSTLSPTAGVLPVTQGLGGAPEFLRLVEQTNPETHGSLVLGDADDDGTYDAFDSCVTKPNPEQVDDDCDGLGDGRRDRDCDPTYCTDFIPRFGAEVQTGERVRQAAAAAFRYLVFRAKATTQCLDRFSEGSNPGTFSTDATLVCRGYFVDGVEVFPLDTKAASLMHTSAFSFWSAVVPAPMPDLKYKGHRDKADDSVEGSTAEDVFRRLLPAYGESVDAATRVVYGHGRRDLSPLGLECQKRLGAASAEYLLRAVKAMQTCILTPGPVSSLAARCIGSLRNQEIVLPEDPKTREVLQAGAARMRHLATSAACAERIPSLDTCDAEPSRAARCIACVNWRRATDAMLATFGPSSPDADLCRRRRASIPAPKSDAPVRHAVAD
jgi:hypothetical protein